jgi:hypothetical protein
MLDEALTGFMIGASVNGKLAFGKPREIEDNIAVESFPREESRPQFAPVPFVFHCR